jgi:DNA-binding NarL/FixJ family response regulator
MVKDILNENPETRILIYTNFSIEEIGLRALKAGVKGVLTKDCEHNELLMAVVDLDSIGSYFCVRMSRLLAGFYQGKSGAEPHPLLTDREYQVFNFLASGKTVKQISTLLNLSVKTISNYRVRALKKLNLDNNSQLMHYAHRNGLL